MSPEGSAASSDLAYKIAKLVEEKGWNQEDFARISQLNRHTVRLIMSGDPKRRLRNATVSQCSEAFGLTVNELRTLPIERLLARVHGKPASDEEAFKLLRDRAVLPELVSWIHRNEDRASRLQPDEVRELLELQNPGGPLERLGVEYFVNFIERRRELLNQVRKVAGTEYGELLTLFVNLLAERVERSSEGLEKKR